MSSDLETRLTSLRDELASCAPGVPPVLVAVSKTVGPDEIRRAHAAGQLDFGENRVQDLIAKMDALADLSSLRWHFIGRLQRNKVRKLILKRVALIHSVDDMPLARTIDRAAAEEGIPKIPILLEVNVSGEATKTGFTPTGLRAELPSLVTMDRIDIRGLMAMAPFVDDEDALRSCFRTLRHLASEAAERYGTGTWLSMGMSNDYLVAVREGATHVRIGTRIFH